MAADTGLVTTVAGVSTLGYNGDNVEVKNAKLNMPNGLAIDSDGNLYVPDTFNNRIRKVSMTAGADLPTNYQGLWWNAPSGSEAGWGINFAHQGDALFATWFTYDKGGKGLMQQNELAIVVDDGVDKCGYRTRQRIRARAGGHERGEANKAKDEQQLHWLSSVHGGMRLANRVHIERWAEKRQPGYLLATVVSRDSLAVYAKAKLTKSRRNFCGC